MIKLILIILLIGYSSCIDYNFNGTSKPQNNSNGFDIGPIYAKGFNRILISGLCLYNTITYGISITIPSQQQNCSNYCIPPRIISYANYVDESINGICDNFKYLNTNFKCNEYKKNILYFDIYGGSLSYIYLTLAGDWYGMVFDYNFTISVTPLIQ